MIDKEREDARFDLMYSHNKCLGICEQLRMIYDVVYAMEDGETKNILTEQLIDAFVMAKKMNDRLQYYANTYHDTTGNSGEHLKVFSTRYSWDKSQERKKRYGKSIHNYTLA